MRDKKALADFPKEITGRVKTPCYLISRDVIKCNCELLDYVQKHTGAKILLALKAFAMPAVFPLISEYLHGVCASGPIEAQMGREEFGREVHTYSPAFTDEQFERTVRYSDHIVFNSVSQWKLFKDKIPAEKEVGLRVNPGHAEVEVDLYNPCISGSRFGVNPADLEGVDLKGIDGLHFHAMCEQNSDVLVRILESFEKRFGHLIPQMKWINFGGGHHITRDDYDVDLLIETVLSFRERYNGIRVYLEPGEAVVLNAGVFVTSVLDTIKNGVDIAVMDCSAETHMPDVLAMPYRPHLIEADEAGKKAHTYKLGGISCLAGDFIGTYSFEHELKRGDRLVFTDMALYSFVKNTSFNGVELPDLAVFDNSGAVEVVRRFGYADYKGRLS
ncbi:carboxynorspermidine decarboxylase [Denitrovibrio acetiphilus DSM 12809]|uniref:Carboxynorspermidine/carboxyspermidine decarboxylase n=1 Tax=Denitrovibrio acetiphilus (strain DSM 12809 / NBRC 114555 / N2460) TaxID=522772 RepID=D4H4Z9_DENA2|nr:carboxynorspermidine decarboxylase [Denitrovibrio acetiphilus]ADD69355.1 carboxynorspermidine decarboxylase [Denitrovibrio acetiphilus DSM 12809]